MLTILSTISILFVGVNGNPVEHIEEILAVIKEIVVGKKLIIET
jgi:hypothetical protein